MRIHAINPKRHPKLRFIACFFLISVNAVAFALDNAILINDPLDGLEFQGLTGEQDKQDHHEDTITFSDGLFRSLDCENWGFGPAPYTVKKDGDTYQFDSTLRSADLGTLEWKGTIKGDTAVASFRWLHERWYWNIDRNYWFKGTTATSK